MAHLTTTAWLPGSKPEKEAVLEQLESLLGHAAFRNSKRSVALLRFIVEQRLQDGASHPKERTLGIEVFGQDADYDTNAHPVVRVVATEIRRRIAQYYDEPGHEREIRIELPPGSYAPEFHLPPVLSAERVPSKGSPGAALSNVTAGSEPSGRRWLPYGTSAVLLMVAVAAVVGWRMVRKTATVTAVSQERASALAQFWSPIIGSPNPVQLVLGTWPLSPDGTRVHLSLASQPTSPFMNLVGWPDLVTYSKIAGLLEARQKGFRTADARALSINDLTQGPAVFIGAFNNPWTIGFTNSLRFHFVQEGETRWIADRKDRSKKYLWLSGTMPGSHEAYAVVARFHNVATGQISLVVAGRGVSATTAAGEFVTIPRYMDELAEQLPKGWESKNIEVLVSMVGVNGQSGAPHIVATQVW